MPPDELHYTRDIKMSRNKKEGLENFLQMIINHAEAGRTRETLLTAVDLLEDVRSGAYDDAMKDAAGFSQIIAEAQQKHADALVAQASSSFEAGQQEERKRIAALLGLGSADG